VVVSIGFSAMGALLAVDPRKTVRQGRRSGLIVLSW
jgi:hypothetical protein